MRFLGLGVDNSRRNYLNTSRNEQCKIRHSFPIDQKELTFFAFFATKPIHLARFFRGIRWN
jgi:hypothetical protein